MTNTNRPAYDAVILSKSEDHENATWLKVGAAWKTLDARGLNLVLSELPFSPDGRRAIYLRPTKVVRPDVSGKNINLPA